ncbi:MAG: DUF4390 domain-containing protein [bacterium]
MTIYRVCRDLDVARLLPVPFFPRKMLIASRHFWTHTGTPVWCLSRHPGAVNRAMRPRFATALLALLLVLAPAAQATASPITIENATLRRSHGLYLLDATLRFGIAGEPLEALRSGVPLTLLVEVEIEELREYLWDRRIGGVRQRYRVEHHALSGHYLVTNLVTGLQDGFPSIEDAADALGELREIPVIDERSLRPGYRYEAAVRARLDLAALPGPLRLVAYLSSEWRIGSPWHRWGLKP